MRRPAALGHVSVAMVFLLAAVIVGGSYGTTALYDGTPSPRPARPPLDTSWYQGALGQIELVQNGSFESGMGSWNIVDGGPFGSWFATSAAVGPLSGIALQPASHGSFQAVVDMTGQGTHILYQDVVIPSGATGSLKMVIWLENYANAFHDPGSLDYAVSPNQQARVDIMMPSAAIDDVGSGVLLNVFKTNPGDSTSLGPTLIQKPIDAFAGQTIRIRIAEVDNVFFFNVGVDAVSILAEIPLPVSEASWGELKSIYGDR